MSYYDLCCMMNLPVKDDALADIELLNKVVQFKEKFYRCLWTRYDKARVGKLCLIPPERNLQTLKDDYEHMQNMIFGYKPDFEVILKEIEQLEREINLIK